ncbi:hypothetical protein MPNT_80058 [Candidatus Methylacidithermus pantelleriae]|uniref:Uncharacterized protein n=1 Tax=Candidatus Methylacidithermus pantelleriae TaxID=2744239 RepID=A0A8J2BWK9_9BACT|nr:hypothetical protein MPNT_80058 [Candidatus Methylacidithermus pantelleriae]
MPLAKEQGFWDSLLSLCLGLFVENTCQRKMGFFEKARLQEISTKSIANGRKGRRGDRWAGGGSTGLRRARRSSSTCWGARGLGSRS